MKYYGIMVLLTVMLVACDGYVLQETYKGAEEDLNRVLLEAQKDSMEWINTPKSIAEHFYPPVSYDGGPTFFELKITRSEDDQCVVNITNEGAIDDEVTGRRYSLTLKKDKKLWMVKRLRIEYKKR